MLRTMMFLGATSSARSSSLNCTTEPSCARAYLVAALELHTKEEWIRCARDY